MRTGQERRALSIDEAARYACVSRSTIVNWMKRRMLAYEELPSRGEGVQRFKRIRKHDLDVFLDRCYRELPHRMPEPSRRDDRPPQPAGRRPQPLSAAEIEACLPKDTELTPLVLDSYR